MNVRMHIIPVQNGMGSAPSYQLSLADMQGPGGASASCHFPKLGQLTYALRRIGFDMESVRFAEKTLKGGFTFTRPGIELSDGDLRKLGIQQMQRGRGGRER